MTLKDSCNQTFLKLSKTLRKHERIRLIKLTEPETAARAKGFKCVAGVDEAGRGPLAGPVVAAVCCIPENLYFSGINDSKLLLPKARARIFNQIIDNNNVHYGVGVVESSIIDSINILEATFVAMRIALDQMSIKPDCLLVDGRHTFIDSIYSEPIIKGDTLSQMIAAASIIAKVKRDQIMLDFHQEYPEYGFDEHKGYATKKHRQALAKFGPCPIHRRFFKY